MTTPDTTGIRKCNARVMKAPRKLPKKQRYHWVNGGNVAMTDKEMMQPRGMPCGKEAVASYRAIISWGKNCTHTSIYHLCGAHDPKSENKKHFPKVKGGGSITSISRLDGVIEVRDEQRQSTIDGLARWMRNNNKSKMTKDDWLEACEEAFELYATREVVDG